MAEKNYLQTLYEEYLEKFRVRSIHELIECFNREVGCKGGSPVKVCVYSFIKS